MEGVAKRAGLEGVRIHDLRHTHASYGAGAGLGLPIIGKLLGHTQASTTQRYAHLDADPLRDTDKSSRLRCSMSLSRRFVPGDHNESEEPVRRHSCRWMLHNSVRCCSERRARSGGPEDHEIHGDLEGHDCEVGSAEARR